MAWIAAAAAIGGALISSQGQEDANDSNRQIQENNSAFNAYQADLNRTFMDQQATRQMDFQQQNANTVWQRGVKDLQAAGLNPMLAYSQGGSPAPMGAAAGGSQASAGAPGNMQNVFANAGHSATQWAQIENIQAQTEKTLAEKDVIESELIDEKGNKKGKWDSLTAAQKNAETGRINHAALQLIEQQKLTREQTERAKEEVKEVIAKTKNLDVDTKLKAVNEVLQRHDIPRMKAEDAYFRSDIGKLSPHNKYGPQTPFRFVEGLGERIFNHFSAKPNPLTPGRTDLNGNERRTYGR